MCVWCEEKPCVAITTLQGEKQKPQRKPCVAKLLYYIVTGIKS